MNNSPPYCCPHWFVEECCCAALFARVDEILHYMWDPIGIKGVPECRNEYSSYAGVVAGMLLDGKFGVDEVATYLTSVENQRMMLPVGPNRMADCRRVSEILIGAVYHFQAGIKVPT